MVRKNNIYVVIILFFILSYSCYGQIREISKTKVEPIIVSPKYRSDFAFEKDSILNISWTLSVLNQTLLSNNYKFIVSIYQVSNHNYPNSINIVPKNKVYSKETSNFSLDIKSSEIKLKEGPFYIIYLEVSPLKPLNKYEFSPNQSVFKYHEKTVNRIDLKYSIFNDTTLVLFWENLSICQNTVLYQKNEKAQNWKKTVKSVEMFTFHNSSKPNHYYFKIVPECVDENKLENLDTFEIIVGKIPNDKANYIEQKSGDSKIYYSRNLKSSVRDPLENLYYVNLDIDTPEDSTLKLFISDLFNGINRNVIEYIETDSTMYIEFTRLQKEHPLFFSKKDKESVEYGSIILFNGLETILGYVKKNDDNKTYSGHGLINIFPKLPFGIYATFENLEINKKGNKYIASEGDFKINPIEFTDISNENQQILSYYEALNIYKNLFLYHSFSCKLGDTFDALVSVINEIEQSDGFTDKLRTKYINIANGHLIATKLRIMELDKILKRYPNKVDLKKQKLELEDSYRKLKATIGK